MIEKNDDFNDDDSASILGQYRETKYTKNYVNNI